jgi:TP901 family phage tail tape measure protein
MAGVQLVAEGASAYFSDLGKGEKAQESFGASAQDSAKAVNSFGSAANKNAAQVEGLTEKLGFQKRSYDILQQELDATKKAYGDNSLQAQKQQLALDQLGSGIKKTTAELDKFEHQEEDSGKASDKFGEIVSGALSTIGGAIANFAMNAGRKLLAFFTTDMVAVGQKFESTMSGISASMAPTSEEFQALTDVALRLGKDTAFSAQEAASAIEALGLNGLRTTDILNGAADATVYLAAATGTDLVNAANITTDTMADFNIGADQLEHAINGISGVTVASKFGIDDYRLALAQAGGVAGAIGVSFDDFNTALTVTSAKFASGADAGTSFKTFLTSLVPKSDAARDKMKELGIITETGSNRFYDAAGNMKSMSEISQVLKETIGGLSEQQKSMALETLFGSDAMRTAIGLADAGSDKFDEMAASIAKVDAKGQGEERMNNFAGAIQEAGGSLETLQIVISQKVLPYLTQLVRKGVVPVLNAFVDMASNSDDFVNSIVAGAKVVSENVMPVLYGLGAAVVTYAVIQIPLLVTANLAAIGSFIEVAAAAGAALGPYVLVAAAIYGVTKAYQDLQEKITSATDELLASKQWWTDSTTTLDSYKGMADTASIATQGLAAALEQERTNLHDQTEALGQRLTMGTISQKQYELEMLALNQQVIAIKDVNDQLNKQITADIVLASAKVNATAQTKNEGIAQDQLVPKIQLTSDELEKLTKAYGDIMDKGVEAMGTLATTHSNFLDTWASLQGAHEQKMADLAAEKAAATTADQKQNIDTRVAAENTGYQQSLVDQALAYAQQAAAQRAALGEQLLAYTENQRQLGNITNEKAAEITNTVVTQFGVQRDSAALLFGQMATTIDSFASGAISNVGDVGTAFNKTEDDAVSLRQRAEALRQQYVMELVADASKPGANIDDLRKKLADIPRRVDIEITTHHKDTYESGGGDNNPGGSSSGPSGGPRAFGGPVDAGRAYLVGEKRPEVFVPETNGTIIPSIGEFNQKYNPPSMNQGSQSAANIDKSTTKNINYVINNPQPDQVDSLVSMIRLQQMMNYG